MKKNCASSWLFYKNYTEMHGQQNIKSHWSLTSAGILRRVVALTLPKFWRTAEPSTSRSRSPRWVVGWPCSPPERWHLCNSRRRITSQQTLTLQDDLCEMMEMSRMLSCSQLQFLMWVWTLICHPARKNGDWNADVIDSHAFINSLLSNTSMCTVC
jgi:hypothetical protein